MNRVLVKLCHWWRFLSKKSPDFSRPRNEIKHCRYKQFPPITSVPINIYLIPTYFNVWTKTRIKVTAKPFPINLNQNNTTLVLSNTFYIDFKSLQEPQKSPFLYASTYVVNSCVKLNCTEHDTMCTRFHSESTTRAAVFLMVIILLLVRYSTAILSLSSDGWKMHQRCLNWQ